MMKKYNPKNDFLLINADISSTVDFNSFFKFHAQNNSDLTICSSNMKLMFLLELCKMMEKKVKKFLKKPKYEFLINSGIYFMNKKILKMIKKDNYLDLNDLVLKAIQKN